VAQIDRAHTVEGGLALNDEVLFHITVSDPTTGYDAPVGSLLLQKPASGEGQLWKKFGSANSAWKKIASKQYVSSSAPTANNDEVDTAGIGTTFERGDIWCNTTNDGLYICQKNSTGAAVWHYSNNPLFKYPPHRFIANEFLIVTGGHPVSAKAGIENDNANTAIRVVAFDDANEEGVGLQYQIPLGVTNIVFEFYVKSKTLQGTPKSVVMGLYFQEVPDNAAVTAWSSRYSLNPITIPTNLYYQRFEQSVPLSTLNLTAGSLICIELTRDVLNANDNLAVDLYMAMFSISYT
jgi:hypothetical protein